MLGVNVFNNLLYLPVMALGVTGVLGLLLPGLPQAPVAVAVVAGSALVAVLDVRVNAWLTGLFLLLEGAPISAVLLGAPDLPTLMASEDPFGLFVATRGGTAPADWIAVGVVVAIVNAVIAWTLACARFLYASGHDGSWGRPLDAWLSTVHPRFGSPWIATLLIGAVGVACCFVPLRLLLLLSGTGLLAVYAGAAVAARRSGASAHAAYRAPLHPLAPMVTLAAIGYVAWVNWFDVQEGRPALIATGLHILVSVIYYRLALKQRGWRARTPS